MNGFAKRSLPIVASCGLFFATTIAAQEPAKPAPSAPAVAPLSAPPTALERRMADPSVKGAMQHVGSALIASGRDATRELSRNALGEWYWAFHSDVRLDDQERDAAEQEFDDVFEFLSTTMADRKVDSLMLAGVDDVATPRCMRWYFVSLDPKGYVLVSVVVYQAIGKPRLRDLRVVADRVEVESILNDVELPTGDQVFTVHVVPPAAPEPTQDTAATR